MTINVQPIGLQGVDCRNRTDSEGREGSCSFCEIGKEGVELQKCRECKTLLQQHLMKNVR